MCIFSVFIGQKCCVHVLPINECRPCAKRVYDPDVEFLKKVSKIVFYKILIMFGINFTTKTELFTML